MAPGHHRCRYFDANCVNVFLQEKCRTVSRERRPTGSRADGVQSRTHAEDKAYPARVCELSHKIARLCMTMFMLANQLYDPWI